MQVIIYLFIFVVFMDIITIITIRLDYGFCEWNCCSIWRLFAVSHWCSYSQPNAKRMEISILDHVCHSGFSKFDFFDLGVSLGKKVQKYTIIINKLIVKTYSSLFRSGKLQKWNNPTKGRVKNEEG